MLASFGAWRFPWLALPELIAQTSDIFEFPLMDRDPLPYWTFGRVTLLGDAAHPMQPIGAQAGSQAIIDGRVLTAALVSASDPVLALRRYDAERRPVMNDIVLRNRQFGPEASLQLVEERAPNGFHRIEEVISETWTVSPRCRNGQRKVVIPWSKITLHGRGLDRFRALDDRLARQYRSVTN